MHVLLHLPLCLLRIKYCRTACVHGNSVRCGSILYALEPNCKSSVSPSSFRTRLSDQLPQDGLNLPNDGQLTEPCTILALGSAIPTSQELEDVLDGFNVVDDVWSLEFLTSVVIQTTLPKTSTHLIDKLSLVTSRIAHVQTVHIVHVNSGSSQLPQGPYFLHQGKLHQAYRLYPDTAGAFVIAVVPADDNGRYVLIYYNMPKPYVR